jgi:hypothetical protein
MLVQDVPKIFIVPDLALTSLLRCHFFFLLLMHAGQDL